MARLPPAPRFFVASPTTEEDVSDYMPVPPSDRGNAGYDDRGMLGFYATNEGKPFDPPADVQFFGGFGASKEDIKRGYALPSGGSNPAYDKVNYQYRSSEPKLPDEDVGNTVAVPSDYEFQNRNNRSKGFLVRRKLPTER